MDFLFTFSDRFIFKEDLNEVRSHLETFSDDGASRSSAFRITFREDNEFSIKSWRFVLGSTGAIDAAVVSGALSQEDGCTVMTTRTRPSYLLLMAFYFLLFVFVLKLTGQPVWVGVSYKIIILVTFGGCAVLGGLMFICAYMLRKQWIDELLEDPNRS